MFRTYVGSRRAQAVNSCTAGLHLALAALGIGPGAEVITTPLTFCATVNTILHVGATPVLADVGPDGNIDPEVVAGRITPNTRAIMPVHFAGLPCRMNEIWDIARKHNLAVIEDAAHAAGARYRGQPIGGDLFGPHSDAVAFSFYATKTMTTGEGGMLTMHSDVLAEKVKMLCLHGLSRDAWNRYSGRGQWRYQVLQPGFKYNLSDIQSAIGIHQLRKLDGFIDAQESHAALYNELFAGTEELELPPDRTDSRHSWHLYTIRLNLPVLRISRDDFIEEMRMRGIGTSVHFIPIPLHPFFAEYGKRPENSCPAALALYPRLVSLPLYPAMSQHEVEFVAAEVKDILWRGNKKAYKSLAPAESLQPAG
jgi:dTDP-4-amino-4,6-dideoxygalactose transaminase